MLPRRSVGRAEYRLKLDPVVYPVPGRRHRYPGYLHRGRGQLTAAAVGRHLICRDGWISRIKPVGVVLTATLAKCNVAVSVVPPDLRRQ